MGEAVNGDGVEPGVGHHHLHRARRGGVALVGGRHIRIDQAVNLGQGIHESLGDLRSVHVRRQEGDLPFQVTGDDPHVTRLAAVESAVETGMEHRKATFEDEGNALGKGHFVCPLTPARRR